jgi:hypothetical protein
MRLDIRQLAAKARLRPGWFSWSWSRDDEHVGSISVSIDEGVCLATLIYNRSVNDQRTEFSDAFRILYTSCNYGGKRPWFECRWCGSRCAILYGVSGDGHFACRRCLRLGYSSESESPMDRLWRKQRKLEARLNWIAGEVSDRPKGMRTKTFKRILDQIAAVEEAKDADFRASMRRFGMTSEELEELFK